MSDNYNTLGGGKVKDKPTIEAGNAAIKRFSKPIVGGVNVLGGAIKKPPTKEELRRLAADAAERRLADNKWCPNEEPKKGPITSTNKTAVQVQCPLCEVFNDCTLDRCRVCDSALTKGPKSDTSFYPKASSSYPKQLDNKRRKPSDDVVDLVDSEADSPPQKLTCFPCKPTLKIIQWGCTACTFLNDGYDERCAMCNSDKFT
jgi:hypothetical protein